jgi:hypothetical protein
MSTIYVFELVEGKYYITEFKNDVIESIESMIKKLIPENDPIKFNSLLTQNLGAIISSIEWIQKYPIKKIAEIRENKNLENIFIEYVKKYAIDNVRCDLYKELKLSDNDIKYIENILDESKESPLKRIQFIDKEIIELKRINDFIKKNIETIDKYLNYNIFYEMDKLIRNQQLRNPTKTVDGGCRKEDFLLNMDKNLYFHNEFQSAVKEMHKHNQEQKNQFNQLFPSKIYPKPKSNLLYINVFKSNFIDNYIKRKIKSFKGIDIILKPILEEHFCNHTLAEEISNALLTKIKCDKLMLHYGTLDEINNKLSKMYYKKCELLHMLETEEIELEEYKFDNLKVECKKDKVDVALESDDE